MYTTAGEAYIHMSWIQINYMNKYTQDEVHIKDNHR